MEEAGTSKSKEGLTGFRRPFFAVVEVERKRKLVGEGLCCFEDDASRELTGDLGLLGPATEAS